MFEHETDRALQHAGAIREKPTVDTPQESREFLPHGIVARGGDEPLLAFRDSFMFLVIHSLVGLQH